MELPIIALESLADEHKFHVHFSNGHVAIMQKCIFSLDHAGHSSGVILDIENEKGNCQFQLTWEEPADDRLRLAHADEIESVEDSAKAIAFLIITEITPYIILRQAMRGSRVDYVLSNDSNGLPFQDSAYLECTGIISGTDKDIIKRIGEKKERLNEIRRDFPVYIVVVEHSFPSAKVEKVQP